jgi:hypothetical protein
VCLLDRCKIGLVPFSFERLPLGAKPSYAVVSEDPAVPAAVLAVSDEQAAGGSKSLKFIDRPGQRAAWTPTFTVHPGITAGTGLLQFDLLLEAGGQFRVEGRDEGSGTDLRVGLKLLIDAQRQVLVSDKLLDGATVPEGQWLHVEIRCALGPQPNKTWSLRITPRDGKPLVAQDLPCDEGFENLQWLGFMSQGTAAGVMFLDNLSLQPAAEAK